MTAIGVAIGLGLLSHHFYSLGRIGAGLASASAALLLCGQALYWSTKRLEGIRRFRRMRAVWRMPITPAGALFIGFTLVVGGAAVYSGNNLIYLTLSAMLAALLVSGVIARMTLNGLQLRLALPDRLFAGQTVKARVGIRNSKHWIATHGVSLQPVLESSGGLAMEAAWFPILRPGEELVASLKASFDHRGQYKEERVILATRFPFGLSERRRELHLSEDTIVYPDVTPSVLSESIVDELESRSIGRSPGESQDLYRIRPALAEDGARYLHWKASARTGGLWVREYALEERRRVRLTLDRRLHGAPDAEREFEERVALCAAVLWKLAERGSAIILASDETELQAEPGGAPVDVLLRYLATVESIPTDAPPPPGADEELPHYTFGRAAVTKG